jgi:hypothetical protein
MGYPRLLASALSWTDESMPCRRLARRWPEVGSGSPPCEEISLKTGVNPADVVTVRVEVVVSVAVAVDGTVVVSVSVSVWVTKIVLVVLKVSVS